MAKPLTLRERLVNRIHELKGNQPRIALLWFTGPDRTVDELTYLCRALEMAECYSPVSELISF